MTLRETVFPALLLLCVLTAGATDVNAALSPQENWNVVLTPVVTEFHDHAGLDHHQPSRKLILSANTAAGESHSFELLAGDGGHSAFSNVAGLQGEVLVAAARDDGQGLSRGGFQPGTLFASTGTAGVVARISADGASVQNPWVVLPDEGQITGLHLDRTGVFGGDLLVVTATGGVWRVSAAATPVRLAALDTRLAGVAVVPDDVLAYGPWAGKVLAGAKELGSVYAIDAQGQSVSFAVGLNPQDIDIVPAHENLYAIDHTSRKLLGAAEGALTGVIGDILVTQESPGRVSRVRWDGTGFVVAALAEAPGLKQVAFSPAGAGAIPAVKQVYEKIAVVRHAPLLDSGRIEGTVWQFTGEDTLFDGTDTITSDLLVPGTPAVTAAASASYGGTIEGTESAAPTGYKVTIAGKASLRHVVTRTAPIVLQEIAFPPAPQGTRDVQLRKAADPIGDPATLRHLDMAGNAGSVAVPPGTYGKFTISGRNTLVLGIDGSTEPTVYNLEELALTGGSSLRLAGPVTLRVRNAVTLVGSTVGAADDPKRLRLEVAHGRPADAVKVGGTGVLYAIVRAPRGKISIYGNGRLRGTVTCDFLHVDGNGVLQITENDIPPPPVNRPPTANAGPDHTITLPTDSVALEGTASDDGLPTGSTLAVTWTMMSGPGPVNFAEADSAATSATFSVDGEYVLKLTASDGQLLSSDTVSVTVIPRNQPPVVDAGQDLTIELPASAELHGSVTDDALPRGVPLTVTWSVADGPGEVTFADAGAAVTTASFSAPGVYTLRLSAGDTEFTVEDDMVVTVLKNVAPSVDAGLDATITLPIDTVALEGTATDDGLPSGSVLAVTWTKVSGPGEVAFGDAQSAVTSATFSLDGVYVLELTASDGALTASDRITITVIPRNEPPVVDAGQALTVQLPVLAELHGSVTDDGLPRDSVLTATWSVADGPGPVTFADPHAAATTASFSAPGVYTLRLSASDTELTVSDDVIVTVLQNQAPSVDAGPDQEITLPSTVMLRGTASDDGQPAGSTLEAFWTQVSGPVPVIFHDAFAATTPVTVTTAGTYVLRLTASDSQLSAADELTLVVHPRPNQPPRITSDAPAEYLLGAVPTGGGETVNLATWTVKQYPSSQGNASWQRDATNTIVTQTINADPSILVSDFNLSNAQMEGTWRVNTTTDDDYIGFVFGYQNSEHFYLFDWKQTSQDVAARGMSLKVVSADSPLTGDDFWPTAGNARVRPLYHNTIGWAEFTDYQFTLQFHPGEIRIVVKRGATVLADFTVNDSTYTNGKFGFYNYSQAAVQYSGFRRLSLARGTYTYDVEAADVDGDAIAYSLASAPVGMTIDPATGLITWPVSSAVAGNHPVSVRVQTPDGRFDVQSYTLTILSPNEPPAVNAGDDRLITTGGTASLNGTATDDGFPRNSTLGVSWSTVSGPGTVTFSNAALAATNATFSKSGSYLLRLSATDGELSASDEVTVTVNTAPVVNAGADQTLAQSNTAVLNGTVTDDGVPSGQAVSIVWEQVSGPVGVAFDNAGSQTTRAMFPGPGTYTLRLTGNDTLHSATDNVTVTVNASPALDGATLALVAGNGGPYATGTSQPLRATLRNSSGSPLANYGVQFEVTGPNVTAGSALTDAAGVATFSLTGANVGTDSIRAFVRHTTVIQSPTVAITWTQAPASPPATQGWIGAPLNGGVVTGVVPVTVAAGITVAEAAVEYWPATNPSAVTVLAAGAQGGPGATLAALDTTLLANGNYVIRLRATDADGQLLVSQVLITVAGEHKPGRITLSVTDLTVPVTGIPITITRRYDSLERNQSGDFGYGWSLEMAGPRLDVSPDYDVTVTEPGTGRRVTFQFAPTGFGFPFSFLYQPAYAAEPGVYGKLTANGCATLIRTSSGVSCYLASDPAYRPTVYTYTDPYGRVYTMTAAGKLVSIRNLEGHVLTFGPSGITSSAGNLTVSFARDSQGRITNITDPTGKVYGYTYDAAGDLASVEVPDAGTPLRYEYAPGHYFLAGTDARGNVEARTTYYPDGRLQSVTDAVGKTTSYAYDLATNTTTITHPDSAGATIEKHDANGMVLSTTDPLGRTTSYTYDANRRKRTQTDALGKTTTYDYDANGHLRSVTDPLNKTQSFTNNAFGQPVTVTDQLGKIRTVKYDARHNLSGISDEIGAQMALTWNERGNPVTFADANGKVSHFTYDAYGNILSKTDPLGRTTSYTHDTMGRVLTMTDTRGVTRFGYDALGRMLSVIDPLSNQTRYEYDANGNRTAVIDARGRTTGYEYDAANRVSKITYPDGTTESYTYNFRGQKTTEAVAGLAVSRTTTYRYDNAGQLVKVIHPDLSEIKVTYDEVGRIRTVTDELNKTVTYEYDPACGCRDRLAKIIDADGKTITYTYDAAGRRISFTDAANRETRYTYDARGRLTKTTFADSTFAETTYDSTGRPLTSTDQEGRVTRFAYDDLGNLLSVTDASGATMQYTYDALKNLLSSTDANGRTTRFEYDALNRLVKRVLPLGMAELYTYDPVGNLATRTDFRGKQTTYEFDPMNRLTARRPDTSLGEPDVIYSYTGTGMRRSMTDASGSTSYTYDHRDRLLTKQTPQGTLSYTYDLAGSLISMRSSNADGVSVDYTYDDLHRLEAIIDNRLAAGTTTYAYDVAGNLKSDSRPNGARSDYTYDALNRLTSIGVTTAGTMQASYAYTRDRTGHRLSVNEGSGRTVDYTYDAVYRLTREAVSDDPNSAGNGVVDYTYDPVGNRLSRISSVEGVLSATSVYDANDRLVSDASDANGNTRSADGKTFVYDFENRIRSANNGAVRITYDGDGNLAAKTVGGVTTRYLVDDLNPTGYSQVVEEIVNGQVQTQYTYGHMIVSQRRRLAGGWATSFYSTDGHGSVRQLTDESGAVTDTYTYDAFGKLISSTGTTPNPYLYAGERFDADLGLYHLRARHYNADRGRFFSMDPYPGVTGDPVSLHKYLYANADPVNLIDPSGLSAGEYGMLSNLTKRWIPAAASVGLGITCVMIDVGSAIATVLGNEEWMQWAAFAEAVFLVPCLVHPGPDLPPRPRRGPDLSPSHSGGPPSGGPPSGGPPSGGPPSGGPPSGGPPNGGPPNGGPPNGGPGRPYGPPEPPKFPGNDPAVPPGPDFQWKGRPGSTPGDKEGNWFNPHTGESLRPDLQHGPPIGPHWDWRPPGRGDWFRIFPDGKIRPK
jgi:RHS repeat-associated protein